MNSNLENSNGKLQTTTHWTIQIQSGAESNNLPVLIAEVEITTDITQVFNCPNISKVKKQVGAKSVLLAVREVVLRTARQYSFSKNMNMEEATMLASDLIETFNYDTLEDIILMFKYLRLGKLKNPKGDPLKINSRIDSDTLFNSIVPAYLDLKSLEREKQYQNHKYQNENIEIAEGSRDKFKELLQKLEQDKKLKTPEEITPVVNHAEYFKNIVEKNCANLTDKQLNQEHLKAVKAGITELIDAYQKEINNRKQNHLKTKGLK